MTKRSDAEVLDGVREWLGRYVRTINDGDLDLLTLWCAHTHLVNETYSSPRLLIDSPMHGSGKTTCMEHMGRLCVSPVQMAAVSSSALLVRLLQDADGNPAIRTLLIDEADRTLRPDKETTPELIAILNSGYKRGATRPVLVPVKGGGWESKEMSTFSPVAMAGNSPNLPEDTRSRTIRVLLLPDLDGTVEESDWELIDGDAQAMGDSLAWWADQHRETVRTTRPTMPEGITGRFREKWQPLARVAAAAGSRWPDVAAALALQDLEQFKADREDGMITDRPHIVLLHHVAALWPEGAGFYPTEQMVTDLQVHHPDSWGPSDRYPKGVTSHRLGRMLATHFKVNSGRLGTGNDKVRGYFREDLHPVMGRMGMGVPLEPAQVVETVKPAPRTGPVGPPKPLGPVPRGGGTKAAPPTCGTCSTPLPASVVAEGFTTHPGCEA